MKKRISLLITGLMASGMILTTISPLTNTVQADEAVASQNTTDKEVTNTITYYYDGEQLGDPVQVKGTYEEPITQAPKGYYVPTFKTFGHDGQENNIWLEREDGKVTNYIVYKDYNGETANNDRYGGIGQVVRGDKVGETVDFTDLGFMFMDFESGFDRKITLKANKSVQPLVVLGEGGKFNGVVRVTNPDGAKIVDRKRNSIGRKLPKGSEWKTFDLDVTWGSGGQPTDLVLYRVAPDQYIYSADSEIVTYTPTNPQVLEGVVHDSYRKVVTTKDKIARLYREDGTIVGNRALGPKTAWKSDLMVQKDGSLMFRVATNEWVKISDLNM